MGKAGEAVNYLMGIDLGTSSVKVIVIDEYGKILAQASEKYPILTPSPSWAEQDPDRWWSATRNAIRKALQSPNLERAEIKAIGFSGQMHGAVFLDSSLKPLRPAIIWADARSSPQCEEIRRKLGEERIIEILSNPIMPGFMAPSLLWVKENEPSIYERIHKVILPKDYIRFKLTGSLATDFSDASATLLFDVRRRCWSEEAISELGFREDFFPELRESAEVVGELSREVAEELSLNKGVEVVTGGGDSPVSAVGCGLIEAGMVSVNIGSAGQVFAVLKEFKMDPKLRIHTFCHAAPDTWYMQGAILSAGITLDWLIEKLGLKSPLEQMSLNPYDKLVEEASRVRKGSEGLIFLPYLLGERSPHMDPDARGAFIGLSLTHGRAHLVRAVMEGVAFALRDSLEILKELGIAVSEITIRGGGGRIKLWRQIIADVFNCRVKTAAVEEAAFGAAILAGIGAKVYRGFEDAIRRTVRMGESCEPSPGREVYDELYEVYRSLYPALRDQLHSLASIQKRQG